MLASTIAYSSVDFVSFPFHARVAVIVCSCLEFEQTPHSAPTLFNCGVSKNDFAPPDLKNVALSLTSSEDDKGGSPVYSVTKQLQRHERAGKIDKTLEKLQRREENC